ncbi:MAG TPA: type II secretion system protein [Ideonella sp.]|jgi:general secretion pathway protein G|uniref:type II secretion system protein n=1 Tax=Ideonella sp. TaxID=1929293 RepID=UPI002E33CE5B|nr:type II secretion system protein [Ideonella sp.]HEX5688081.1 type II secretion system protein [Ideonella sp.]
MSAQRLAAGFTLIELLVVMAILALLLTIAAPRYFHSVDAAKESVLRENLRVTRDAIAHFRGDLGRYPDSLDELVTRKYLSAPPMDPITSSNATWELIPPSDEVKGNVADLRSGALGSGRDGSAFRDW